MAKTFQTSDQGLAAFLCCQGFTFLGAVETDRKTVGYNGHESAVMEFIFIDEELKLPQPQLDRELTSLTNQLDRVQVPRQITDSLQLFISGEGWVRGKQYFSKMRLVRQSLRNPIREDE